MNKQHPDISKTDHVLTPKLLRDTATKLLECSNIGLPQGKTWKQMGFEGAVAYSRWLQGLRAMARGLEAIAHALEQE